MICPRCHAEFRPGFTVCSDCGIALVEELDVEAVAVIEEEAGGLEPFHETGSSDELAAILEAFEEQGVAYVVQAGTALSLLSSDVDPGDLPEDWQARVLVVGSHRARAREILRELRRQALDARAASQGGVDRTPL